MEKERNSKTKKLEGKYLERLTSRKFLLAIFAALIPILNKVLEWGLTENDIYTVVGILGLFIGVEGYRDITIGKNEI